MVEAALEFIRGDIPSFTLTKKTQLESRKFLGQSTNIHLFFLGLLESDLCSKLNHSLCIFSILFFLSVVLIYSLSWGKINIILPTLFWFGSFFTMCLSAVNVLIRWKNQRVFQLWSLIFYHFNQDLKLDLATQKFNRKFIFNYVIYFFSLLIYLMFLPLITTGVLAFIVPPLILISCLMLTSMLQSNISYNILGSILYIIAHNIEGQRYLKEWLNHTLPFLSPYIIQESFGIYDYFSINFDIGSIFHGLWFVSLIFVSLTIGLYGILLHGLCITWFHTTLMALDQHLSSYIYCSIILWSLILFLPQSLYVFTILGPVFLATFCCFIGGVPVWLTVVVFIFVSILLATLTYSNFKLAAFFKCVILVLSMVFLFQQQAGSTSDVSPLKWEQFQNICLPTRETIEAHLVRDCRLFRGTIVQWQASIKQIEIESVFNLPETVIAFLPTAIQQHLKCFFGVPTPLCEKGVFSTDADYHRCLAFKQAKGSAECSLENWNEYKFHFVVSMGTNFWKFSEVSELVLVGGNEFHEAVFNLSMHDRVSFIGTLYEGLGTMKPRLTLTTLNCLDCRIKNVAFSNSNDVPFDLEVIRKSVKLIFNFFFGPTLTI